MALRLVHLREVMSLVAPNSNPVTDGRRSRRLSYALHSGA